MRKSSNARIRKLRNAPRIYCASAQIKMHNFTTALSTYFKKVCSKFSIKFFNKGRRSFI